MMMNSEIQPLEPLESVEMVPIPGEGFPIQCPNLVGDGGPADILMSAAFFVAASTPILIRVLPYLPPKSPTSA